VLLKARSLYEAAIDARKKGQRVVLVGRDYPFIKDIVGFDQERQVSGQREIVAR
jgi:hypothetical protein